MCIAYYPATNRDLEAEQQETCMTVIKKITFKHRSQMVGVDEGENHIQTQNHIQETQRHSGVDEGENEHYFEKVPIRKATAR